MSAVLPLGSLVPFSTMRKGKPSNLDVLREFFSAKPRRRNKGYNHYFSDNRSCDVQKVRVRRVRWRVGVLVARGVPFRRDSPVQKMRRKWLTHIAKGASKDD